MQQRHNVHLHIVYIDGKKWWLWRKKTCWRMHQGPSCIFAPLHPFWCSFPRDLVSEPNENTHRCFATGSWHACWLYWLRMSACSLKIHFIKQIKNIFTFFLHLRPKGFFNSNKNCTVNWYTSNLSYCNHPGLSRTKHPYCLLYNFELLSDIMNMGNVIFFIFNGFEKTLN